MTNWTLPQGCRGLIFDCDGTLVDSMPLHYEAWTVVMRRHNIHFPKERFYQWAGITVYEIIQRLAADSGRDLDAESIAAERDAYFHNLPEDALQPVVPVVEIARRFHRKVPMAVATGSSQASASASLKAIGILDWFEAIVNSLDAGRPKPAPDVFLRAAERIALPPAACVAFEDGDAGIQAAAAAGMQVIDIRPWLTSGSSLTVSL